MSVSEGMLAPHERDKLHNLHGLLCLAQRRLAKGLRLNIPEANALISGLIIELAREGTYSVADLMDLGHSILGFRQVLPGMITFIALSRLLTCYFIGVAYVLHEVQIEALFNDGTKLVTIHSPICNENGDLDLALRGSFLPTPRLESFKPLANEAIHPGKIYTLPGHIKLNEGRSFVSIQVTNTADRPIQVGSHYHFIETNQYLKFDRIKSYGKRLNVPSGTAIRFEPGESKLVTLVDIGGLKVISGGNNLFPGSVQTLTPAIIESMKNKLIQESFLHEDYADAASSTPIQKKQKQEHDYYEIPRGNYANLYGPTTGDIVRLADTELYVRVEKDYTCYGDECKFGGGKVLREGMGQATGVEAHSQLDTVIINALIIDYTGIYKADIGIKNGKICGIGKAGNPDTMNSVTPGMIIGVNTDVISAEGKIVTAGGMDAHIHFICPDICTEAIASGLTTLLGGGTGPSSGSCATTCTPGKFHLKMMMEATDNIPLNFGFTGKGNTSSEVGLVEIIEAGVVGLKLHEDWGTTPASIDNCLNVADKYDIQVTIHTDTLNESCCVERTVASFKNRTIHTYHTEGAGGGHAPDIITVCSLPNVLPSSTNPTRPLTVNTIDEHLDMLMVCHHLSKSIPEDISFAESRIRKETIAAEDILQDMGAISMISSDSQAMGRVGEVITRTWQTADKMKRQLGQLDEDIAADAAHQTIDGIKTDNYRVRRYVAKYTINPCIAHGMSHVIGSVEVNKLADLVLWTPAFFGVKPEIVIKGGHIAWSQMGDANASIPTPQPVYMRPMFGAIGNAPASNSILFLSQAAASKNVAKEYNIQKTVTHVFNTRNISKSDMKLNDATPDLTVDPETFVVVANNKVLTCEPISEISMGRLYFC